MKPYETTRRVYTDLYGSQDIAGIRAASQIARGAGLTAMNTGTQYAGEATDIGSMLVPELTKEALHPQGFSPTDVNNMLVAGQEGAGGTTSSIAGEAANEAARSRNVGGSAGVLDEAAREKMRANSANALGVQNMNARLKESQRQAGLKGLQEQRGTDIKANLEAQGLVPEDINAWAKANSTGWLQNTLGVLDTLSGAGKAAGSVMTGIGALG